MGESLFFTQKRLLFTSYIPTRSYKTKVQKNSGSLYRNNLSRLPLMFSGRLFLIQQEKAARFFVFHIALIRHYCALESENEGKEDKPHMKKTDKAIIIDCLWKMLALGAEILSRLDDTTETEENPSTATVTEAPNKPVTLEAVRAILAEKARTGFRAEVKALLTEYGADKLSDITDPDKLATLMEKAGVIGGA